MLKRIWVSYQNQEYPFIKIDSRAELNRIVIMPNFHTSHITLHKERDGKLLCTHYDDYKQHGTWDKLQALTAKHRNYPKWKRHANYYQHGYLAYPVHDIQDISQKIWGAYLCGLRYELNKIKNKNKYQKDEKEILILNSNSGFCNFYFSEFDKYQPPNYDHVTETIYGKLYIIIE